MVQYFFDTSALVKRYHEEPGTERVDDILDDDRRTLYGLQLSAALSLGENIETLRFVTADAELADIGDRYGLDTIVPA